MTSAEEITSALAKGIYEELLARGITIDGGQRSTEDLKTAYRGFPYPLIGRKGLTQIHCTIFCKKEEREKLTAEQYARPIAKEMGCKLARPYPMLFEPLEIPLGGVHEADQRAYKGVFVRMVTSYYIAEDEFLTRFDCLVEWNDS